MIDLTGVKIGFAMTGSFCTFSAAFQAAEVLLQMHATLIPIMSAHAASISTRFGDAAEQVARLENLCHRPVIHTIADAEPIGPTGMTDLLLVAPCTGNTMAKLAHSITDTAVTMAVKSHLRNEKPVLLAMATNDALAGTAKNLGILMNQKHYYFVPFAQDDANKKPRSLVADFSRIPDSVAATLSNQQLQPIVLQYT